MRWNFTCSTCSPTFNDALTSRTFLFLLSLYSINQKNQHGSANFNYFQYDKIIPVIFIYFFIFSIIPIRSSKGVNKVQIIRQSSKNPLKPRLSRHPLNTAVANEKYFYHCCITSHFLVFLGISGFVSLCNFLLSGITWFIFA